jgi:hypothetical protein
MAKFKKHHSSWEYQEMHSVTALENTDYQPSNNHCIIPINAECRMKNLPQRFNIHFSVPNVAMLYFFQIWLEPEFSVHSFDYRSGRSAHNAVKAARNSLLSSKTRVAEF